MSNVDKPDYTITLPENATSMDLWRALFPTFIDAVDKPAIKYFNEVIAALNARKISVGALLGMTETAFVTMKAVRESELRRQNPQFTDEQVSEEMLHWASGVSWAHEYIYRNNSLLISVQTKVPCPDFLPLHPNQVRGNNAVGEDMLQFALQNALKRVACKPSFIYRIGRWLGRMLG